MYAFVGLNFRGQGINIQERYNGRECKASPPRSSIFVDIMAQVLKKKEIELIDRGMDLYTATQELERTKKELIQIYARMIMYRNYLAQSINHSVD